MIYYKLDKIDEQILDILQENARMSLKDIAERVSMSPTAVGTRIDKMLSEAVRDAAALREKCRAFDAAFRSDMESVGGEKYATIAELAWRQSFAACTFVANESGEPFMFSAENGSGGMIGTTDVFYPQLPHLLLTSLTLTLTAPVSGLAHYHFDFVSGSTAPTLSLPGTVTMPDDFQVEADNRYEVDILNNYGTAVSWATS